MSARRPLWSIVLALLLAGCSTTHTIHRADSDALSQLNEALSGKRVSVVMVTERARGRLVHVAPDSTRWQEGPSLRAAPTSELRAIVYDRRDQGALWGAALGAGLGTLTLLAAYLGEDEGLEAGVNRIAAQFIAASFVTMFAIYGYLLSSPVEYRFGPAHAEAGAVEE